jgi:hypothetical protein
MTLIEGLAGWLRTWTGLAGLVSGGCAKMLCSENSDCRGKETPFNWLATQGQQRYICMMMKWRKEGLNREILDAIS